MNQEPWMPGLVELAAPLAPGDALDGKGLIYEVRRLRSRSTPIAGRRRTLFVVVCAARTQVVVCLKGTQRQWALSPEAIRDHHAPKAVPTN